MAGHKLHSDYDQANWLTDQIDSTLNQQVLNSFTPLGLESSREIDQINGPGSFNLKQKTSWSYFANGKLSGLTTTVPSQTPCQTPCQTTQTIESHTVSYLDSNPKFAGTSGVYVNSNRTQDQYSLRLGASASSPCTASSLCTASYTLDPRDRLVTNTDTRAGTTTTTNYSLDGAGNIQSQSNGTLTVTNSYNPNNANQLQKSVQTSVSGSQTFLYWYDDLGHQQCVTDATVTSVTQPTICNPSEQVPASSHLLQDYKYDYLDRLQTYRTFSGGRSPTDEANYVYDALNRMVQETEVHPGFNGDHHVTQFSYLGLGGLETEEQQTSQNSGKTLHLKDLSYDVYGHRLAMTDTPYTNGVAGTPTTSTYGYDVHGSVSQLVDPNGNTTESYGYTPYGQSDSQLTQLSPGNTDKTTPLNPFRFSASRLDTGSGTLNMGVRNFGPDIAHFLTPDFFYGSLSDLSLSIDPLTQNRYDLAGGNPISFKESTGHQFDADGGGGAATTPTTAQPQPSCGWSNVWGCVGQGWNTVTSGAGQAIDLGKSQVGQHAQDPISVIQAGLPLAKAAVNCSLAPFTGGCKDITGAVGDAVSHPGETASSLKQAAGQAWNQASTWTEGQGKEVAAIVWNRSKQGPDYVTLDVSGSPLPFLPFFLVGGSVTYTRAGHLFLAPETGVGVPGVTGSLRAGWIDTGYRPSRQYTDSFISGWSLTGTGFVPVVGPDFLDTGVGPSVGEQWGNEGQLGSQNFSTEGGIAVGAGKNLSVLQSYAFSIPIQGPGW